MSAESSASAPLATPVADLADLIVVLVRWMLDPERPAEPKDLGPPGLLGRLNGVHRNTVPILGPVVLPGFQSLFGASALPAVPTLVRRAAAALNLTDRLPAYNTIDAAVRALVEGPTAPLTPSQSIVARIILTPLERPGATEALRAAIVEAAPASAFGFAHIVNAWLHSARLEHPDSYVLDTQRQLVVDDGHLTRCGALERTAHAHRLLPADDPWLLAFDDPLLRRMLRQLDTTLYLFAAQHAENGVALAKAGYAADLFDPIYQPPYSRRHLTNRFFTTLREHAEFDTWSALSLDGKPRVVGENSTSHEQLTKWRSGVREMSRASLEKLLEHSTGFDPARREDDLAVFAEGYRVMLSTTAASSRLDALVGDHDTDPRSVLFGRVPTYLLQHRADLGTRVPGPAFT